MVSLNDLDDLIGKLEGSDEEGSSADDDSASSPEGLPASSLPPVPRHRKKKKPKKKLAKTAQPEDSDSDDTDSGEDVPSASEADVPLAKTNKRSETKAEADVSSAPKQKRAKNINAICFKYLAGSCKFDDCRFLHVNPLKLTLEERSEVLRELPLRQFDQSLAVVIGSLNIPQCKDFHQRGGCNKPPGRCHFWHLTSGAVAKWAGFDFWCDACSKAFTSEEQMLGHQEGRAHLQVVGKGGSYSSAGRGGRGRANGTGRGYANSAESAGLGGGRGRGHANSDDSAGLGGGRGRGVGRGVCERGRSGRGIPIHARPPAFD